MGELASKAIQPIVFIVLARLLTPEDFGVMTAALMVIGFSQIFWEAGMGKALIQRQTDVEEAANAAFWINLVLGIIISVCLYLSAGFAAQTFFQDERVKAVLQVMTLQVIIGSAASVYISLMQKNFNFKMLFWIRFLTVSIPGLGSIPLAWIGMGYWSLVVGSIIGQLAQLIMIFCVSSWSPKWAFNKQVGNELGRFGVWVAASGLMGWLFIWFDSFVVGIFLGSHELGLYRMGTLFVMTLFSFLFGPVIPVCYSYIANKISDIDEMKIAYSYIVKLIACISIPLGVVVCVNSSIIADAFFDNNWKGIDFIIMASAIINGLSWVVCMNGEFYRASGKPKIETLVMLVSVLFYIPIYLITISNGLESFMYGRVLSTVIGFVFQVFFISKCFKISSINIFSYVIGMISIYCFLVYTCSYLITNDFISKYNIFVNAVVISLCAFLTYRSVAPIVQGEYLPSRIFKVSR